MRKTKQEWCIGDVFSVPQLDGQFCVGQILDQMMHNIVSCSFYNIRYFQENFPVTINLQINAIIATVSTNRVFLDRYVWKVVNHQPIQLPREFWPNEQYRSHNWIGAEHCDPEVVEKFLNAYYALSPWDIYYDPLYFDKMLFSPDKKPQNLIYKPRVPDPRWRES